MTKAKQAKRKLSVKEIIQDQDNWPRYQESYAEQVTADQIAEVEKMLGCGDLTNGFATYICLSCGEQVKVAFSGKSRVCSSCGKVPADEWSKQLGARLFNVTHRHITFTVPSELWPHFEAHPYGKNLKVNYHLPVLVTEGGLDEADSWHEQSYISYAGLRKLWQAEVLSWLREAMGQQAQPGDGIDRLFGRYGERFYVYAEPRVKQGEGISRYIGRYVRHPAIADSRIIAYDGRSVTFYYQECQQRGKAALKIAKMPVLEFIHGVVRHIPPKQFKMVRYYGLYAPRKIGRIREILTALGQAVKKKVYRLGWRWRIKRDFRCDPLRCPRCGQPDMELYSLTVRYGNCLITLGSLIEVTHPLRRQLKPSHNLFS